MFQYPWVYQREQNTADTGERMVRTEKEERNKSDNNFRHDRTWDSSLNFGSI